MLNKIFSYLPKCGRPKRAQMEKAQPAFGCVQADNRFAPVRRLYGNAKKNRVRTIRKRVVKCGKSPQKQPP